MSNALNTFSTAFAQGETWALVVVAVIVVVGICGIAGYGAAATDAKAKTNANRAEMRRSAHSWDRD